MRKTPFLWWQVEFPSTHLLGDVSTLVVESIEGKKRIFVPGRRAKPHEVTLFSQKMIAYSLLALMQSGWKVEPSALVGVPILTEGLSALFHLAFAEVWPKEETAGTSVVICKRRPIDRPAGTISGYQPFEAKVFWVDDGALSRLANQEGTVMFFDIGATGATIATVLKELAGRFNISRAIFASPATSLEAITTFVRAALEKGFEPEDLAVVAHEGIFGLGEDGTALSLQLPGAITSRGNLSLSRRIYPHRGFCHIGAGGLAANCHPAYLEELESDEKRWGRIHLFDDINQAMKAANISWPNDFGGENKV